MEYQGSCLCGRVRYVVSAEIGDVSHCHCSMCRKAHGAAFATYGNVPLDTHRFVAGKELLCVFGSSPNTERVFCSACGSPLLWRNPAKFPGVASFPLGSLDTAFHAPRQRHIYVASKAPWHDITDSWPQSE